MRFDGIPKISIARDTINKVLSEMDQNTTIGLMVYGHRTKGECNDIELIIPPATHVGDLIVDSVMAINPRGKTPLTDATRQAAEFMKHTENKVTIILITDGKETCEADPCALSAELEATGIDFTAHVVGLGLSKEEGQSVSCIAENTGGIYTEADNTEELTKALVVTLAEREPAPDIGTLSLSNLTADPLTIQSSSFVDVEWTGQRGLEDRIFIVHASEDTPIDRQRLYTSVNPSSNTNTVRIPTPVSPGNYRLGYWEKQSNSFLAFIPIDVTQYETSLTLSAPTAAVSSFVNVTWAGPGRKGDTIFFVNANNESPVDSNRLYSGIDPTSDSTIVRVPTPAVAGIYRLGYWHEEAQAFLAFIPITVNQ